MEQADARMLFAHAAWADSVLWRGFLDSGIEDAGIPEKLHHLHVVQWAYLRVWKQEPVAPPALETFRTLADMRDWARQTHADIAGYLDNVPSSAVGEEIRLPWADHLVERFGKALPATWAETVLQVVMHTTYHRGQVAMRMRELGAEPPLTDLIAWIWMGRPEAQWPEN